MRPQRTNFGGDFMASDEFYAYRERLGYPEAMRYRGGRITDPLIARHRLMTRQPEAYKTRVSSRHVIRRVGQVVRLRIYQSRPVLCRVLAVRPHGTVDVERLSDGRCFRLSGLGKANR